MFLLYIFGYPGIHPSIPLLQGYSNLAREIHFPAEFSSNPNQTHLSMLINVFRIIRQSQVLLITVWSGLELNSAGKWISQARFEDHCSITLKW